ncbi:metallophosphoesterase [Hanstruepera ponticola]|uniref:metallophosphoesterase n=1 Tax=Hanstruepera ponticola TaxID=2042995 RepID=UPI000CF16BC9|nr:metallophosphoesterase [Hanstruepera ponticola]
MKNYKILLTFLIIIICNSCATFKAQYKDNDYQVTAFPDKEIDRRFYLIGDVGAVNDQTEILNVFKKHLKENATSRDFALFLGDNSYPNGFQPKESNKRQSAEDAINKQVDALKDFKGKALFIPGHLDWKKEGVKGLKRQEKYIEDILGKNRFQPENGCPLESIDVSKSIQLIVIDTQWYLEDWDKNPTINDECEIKTRERFFVELEGEIKKAGNRTIVLAMHHPMFTNGIRGGFYPTKKHIFPFNNYIPLPVIGSLITQIKTQGGVSTQDRYNERYNDLMRRLETLVYEEEKLVLVSGHEHTLQYIENETIKQIVSGSGSNESTAVLANNGLFSYGKNGFAELTVFKDGSSWVRFYGVNDNKLNLLYQKEVISRVEHYNVSQLPDTFPNYAEVSIYSNEETDKSGFYKYVFGDHYRSLYSTKIKAKVATLDTLYGGLEIVRKGGGHQTRSLRLKTKDGRELNMRALKKSATQFLQTVLFKDTYIIDQFEETAVEDFIMDFYTAAHPYAFLAVPDLSDAAKIYHTNPKLYFIPKHKYLGDYNAEYGGELYMIEERPEENYANERNFGYADDIESSHDIIEKIREDEKHKIDELTFIRARLFDMLLGDWDRHQDQWRWAQFDLENGDNLFKPIPRDRDQVFSNFDGALLDVAKVAAGAAKQLQTFEEELKDVKWINNVGIRLDRVLIQQSGKNIWLEQAELLQEYITDDVIDQALSKMPIEVQDETFQEIKTNLKARRNSLKDIAERYYNYMAELVVLTGTDKDDYIEIIREENNKTRVIISRIIDGKKEEVIVDRVFDKAITKELWVYGLDDKDIFEVTGNSKGLIFTRLIGGQNNDTYIIKNGRRIKVYDHKTKKNTVEEKNGASFKFTNMYDLNHFDFKKNILRSRVMTPNIGFNPDDGVLIGLSYASTIKGFKRNPFSQQHKIKGGYYFATGGLTLDYNGEFANVFGDWNLSIGGYLATENFTYNFFGFGNETQNWDDDLGMDYNRVRTGIYGVDFGVLKRGHFGSQYGFKTIFQGIEVEDTNDRFITDVVPATNSEFYERMFFGAIEGNYNYSSFDRKINPTRAMAFDIHLGTRSNLEDIEDNYGYLNTSLGFYNAISKNRKLVLKTDAKAQFRFGDNYTFYQAANIGGNNGLRGYRNQRFTGQHAFIGSADLRYSFNSFKTGILPLQIGVFGGFDVGRVWLDDEASKKWHNDYGLGIWVATADSLAGTVNLFNGSDGLRFSFGFALDF